MLLANVLLIDNVIELISDFINKLIITRQFSKQLSIHYLPTLEVVNKHSDSVKQL